MFSTSFPQGQINRAREYLGGTKHHPGGVKLLILALVGLCLFSFAVPARASNYDTPATELITNIEVHPKNGKMYLEFDATGDFNLTSYYITPSYDPHRWSPDEQDKEPNHRLEVKNNTTNTKTGWAIDPQVIADTATTSSPAVKHIENGNHYELLLHNYYRDGYQVITATMTAPEIINQTGLEYFSDKWHATDTIELYSYVDDGNVQTDTITGEYYTPVPVIDNFSYTSLDELPVTVKWHYKNRPPGADTANMTLAQDDYIRSYDVDFSISTTTTSGTTTFQFPPSQTEELTKGTYDQNVCVFSDSSTAPGDTSVTGNLCPDFEITIATGTSPKLPLPTWEEVSTTTAENFYDEHSDYATPTPAFNVIFESIEPAYQWISNITDKFKGFFKIDEATEKGKQMGDAIATARAYADSLDAFLGGVPISWALMIYITIALAIMVYRIIRGLIQTFKPM